MLYIQTKTNWPLITKARVLLQTSENEKYILTARLGKMFFDLSGEGLKISFKENTGYRVGGVKKRFVSEYTAYQNEKQLVQVRCKKLLSIFGDYVLINNKWVTIPNFFVPYIKAWGLTCDRLSLAFGSEIKAGCSNSSYKRESLILISYLWVRKWNQQD